MSLRLRLLVAVGAVALVALAVADVATYRYLHSFLYNRIDQSLLVARAPIERGYGGVSGAAVVGDPDQGLVAPTTDIFVEVRAPTGSVLRQDAAVEPNGDKLVPRLPSHLGANGEPVYLTVPSAAGHGQMRALASRLRNGDVVVVAASLAGTDATLSRLLEVELAVSGAALVLAVAAGWWLVRVGLRPLAAVERTAELIDEGDLSHRVPGEAQRSEVGRLAGTVNTMLGRIETAFAERDATEAALRRSDERLRRFVADASHELRTPLAAVSAYAELFERGASSHPEDLARAMAGIRVESARMGHLVEDLLLLARLDEGRPLRRVPVELASLAGGAVDAAAAVAAAGVAGTWPVVLEASEAVEVAGDPAGLRQVLDNLLANVRSHTPAGTRTEVRVRADGGRAVLEVADDGPGMATDQAVRVFERFYRADPSRSRVSGGAGLGLSIVAAIVAAHRGSIEVATAPGQGTTFIVVLPMATSQLAHSAASGEVQRHRP